MRNCWEIPHLVNHNHVETHGRASHKVVRVIGRACLDKFTMHNCGENPSVELIGFPHNYELRIMNYEFYPLSA